MTTLTRTGPIESLVDRSAAPETQRLTDPGIHVEAAYRAHAADVNRFLLALTHDPDEAADLTAEVFERAVRAARKLSFPAERPLPWLLLTARRSAVDRWRRAARLTRSVARLPRTLVGSSEQDRSESLVWLDAVTAGLPARQREALFLRYHDDLSDGDIAAILGLTESGVRSLVARGIAFFRTHEELL